MSDRVRRIGLLAHGFSNWGGGIDFLRVVASSIQMAAPGIELHVLVPSCGPLIGIRNLRDWSLASFGGSSKMNSRPNFIHLQRAFVGTEVILHQIDLGHRALERACKRYALDVVLPAISPQPSSSLPWVGYVFDFQHKYLPYFFTKAERYKRDQAFSRMLDTADAVIVNAQAVANDIEDFYPNHRAKVFVMPFSPAISSDSFSEKPEDVAIRYKINGPYFIVCNQFWKHKDHETVFNAFASISHRHPDLSLVCTGAESDYRFPDHFSRLMAKARNDGINQRLYCLGLIPKADQLALLRGAVALIQPTLFEGGPGGGAVYDAVSLGQRSIVSDISVNMEIEDPTVTFFKAGDLNSLAFVMEDTLKRMGSLSLQVDFHELVERNNKRQRACGELLLQAVKCVVDSFTKKNIFSA